MMLPMSVSMLCSTLSTRFMCLCTPKVCWRGYIFSYTRKPVYRTANLMQSRHGLRYLVAARLALSTACWLTNWTTHLEKLRFCRVAKRSSYRQRLLEC